VCRTRHRQGRLAPAQITALEALPGWAWHAHEDLWPQAIEALQAWSAEHGAAPIPHDDIAERRASQPWYTTKTTPAFGDMVVKLRRTIIAARHIRNPAGQPGPDEITAVICAWEAAAA
jgi:hypothetical protein